MTTLIALILTPIALSALPHLLPGARASQSETAVKQRAIFEAAMKKR